MHHTNEGELLMRSGSEKVTLARFTKPLNPLHKTQVLEARIIQGKV